MANKSTTSKRSSANKTESVKKSVNKSKRFYRPKQDRVVGGVASGIARMLDNLDPLWIRLGFVFFTLMGGAGVPIYVILWILVPGEEDMGEIASSSTVKSNANELREKAVEYVGAAENVITRDDSKLWLGIVISAMGFFILMRNLGLLTWFRFGDLWPIIFIALGIALVIRDKK
jgi:phage shock protein C